MTKGKKIKEETKERKTNQWKEERKRKEIWKNAGRKKNYMGVEAGEIYLQKKW